MPWLRADSHAQTAKSAALPPAIYRRITSDPARGIVHVNLVQALRHTSRPEGVLHHRMSVGERVWIRLAIPAWSEPSPAPVARA